MFINKGGYWFFNFLCFSDRDISVLEVLVCMFLDNL